MDTRVHYNNIFASSVLTQQNNVAQKNTAQDSSSDSFDRAKQQSPRDVVLVPNQAQPLTSGTRLLSETIEDLQNGYRKTQKFEHADGRQFIKIEEVTSNEKQSRRTVVQQNASGSTHVLEDIFDRQADGTFRQTQRFTNEIGETSVNIDPNARPPNADFVLGRVPSNNDSSAFNPTRGNEINVII